MDTSCFSDAFRIANMIDMGKRTEIEYTKKLKDFYIDLIKNAIIVNKQENIHTYINYKIDDVFVINNLRIVLKIIGCTYIDTHNRIDRISFRLPKNWEEIANKKSNYPKCIIPI